MTTFREGLKATEQALIEACVWCGHGYESAHDEAVALVLAAAEMPVDTGTDILEQNIPEDALARLATYVDQRTIERIPVAYIIGRAWLGPLEFVSDSRALVPRSPLMAAIETGFAPWWRGVAPRRIVDLCCGGGSLGLLAAWAYPDAEVLLLDIDTSALELAAQNLTKHQCTNAAIVQGDLLSPLAPRSADVILANPPYVDAEDMSDLPPEYHHEPRLALAAGDDGLDLVHQILRQAADVLSDEGVLFLEVGNSWSALEASYPTHGFVWLQFESGGHGVCALEKSALLALLSANSTS